MYGHIEVMELLLDKGADWTVVDKGGWMDAAEYRFKQW
jgi:hypothetical protein